MVSVQKWGKQAHWQCAKKISVLNLVTFFFFYTWKYINESIYQTGLSLLPYQWDFKFSVLVIISPSVYEQYFTRWMLFWKMTSFYVRIHNLGWMVCIKKITFLEWKQFASAFIVFFSLLVLHNSEKQPYNLVVVLVSYRKLESTGWLRSSKPWLCLRGFLIYYGSIITFSFDSIQMRLSGFVFFLCKAWLWNVPFVLGYDPFVLNVRLSVFSEWHVGCEPDH